MNPFTCAINNKFLLALLAFLLLVSVVASRPAIPYDGQQVHVKSRYRQHHATFEKRARHYGHHNHHHHQKSHNDKVIISGHTDTEQHILHHHKDYPTTTLGNNIKEQTTKKAEPKTKHHHHHHHPSHHHDKEKILSEHRHHHHHHSHHHDKEVLPKETFVFEGHGKVNSHNDEYPADTSKVLLSMQTDPEHVLHNKKYTTRPTTTTTSENSSNSKEQTTEQQQQTFQDAFLMFLVWILDNLFWLVPFVAHSPWNAVWFMATYQTLILASCLVFTPEATIASAHALNNLYGISGAIFCWVLTYCFYVQFQNRFERQVATSLVLRHDHKTNSSNDHDEDDLEEQANLERPLIRNGPLSNQANPDTVPPAWLVVAMTIVAAVDEIFFVPTMVQNIHVFTVSTVFLASFSAVLLLSTVAMLIATTRFQRVLVDMPLYMPLATVAAAMSGHALWDFWASGAASWNALRNLNYFHVSRKLH